MRLFLATCTAAIAVTAGSALAQDSAADLAPLPASGNLVDGILTNIPGLKSARVSNDFDFLVTPGDTYDAALLGQSATQAAFLTNTGRDNNHPYDLAPSLHGTHASGGAVINFTEAETVTGVNSLRVSVAVLSADGSPLWPNLNIGTNPMTQGRLDVGAGAFTNGLLWDNLPGPITGLSITNAVFADGALLATSGALTNGRTLPEMGSLVVWNGVVGSGVDESQMIFDITYQIPEPSSMALLGLAGLVGLARRRR